MNYIPISTFNKKPENSSTHQSDKKSISGIFCSAMFLLFIVGLLQLLFNPLFPVPEDVDPIFPTLRA